MKRKFFTLFLALAASVGTLFAEKVQIGDLYYILNETDKTAEVTYESEWDENNYQGLTTANIPASVTYSGTTYSVTSIGYAAFLWCSSLTSVTIPNSVTSIGEDAFRYCSGLTSVTIPNSVTSIGGYAFYGCTGLTSPVYNAHVFAFMPESYSGAYTIPDGIASIADYAFAYCSSLTSVTIPNSVTSIDAYAFKDCSGLTSVTIPNSVISIGVGAFYGCYGLPIIDNLRYADTYLVEAVDETLSSYTIKNGTKWIGSRAFNNCSSLTSLTIPNSVTSIGEWAFEGCSSLTSIEFPASLEYFDEGVINGCIGLVSIKIPSSVLSIGEYYGAECVNNGRNDCDLYYMYKNTVAGNVQVDSDSGLPYLSDNAKNSLPNLKIVEAPAWFFDVPEDGWAFCPKSLEKVIVNRGELNDNVFGVISRSYKTLKSLNVEAVSNTTLADEAFKDNYNLTELILPANLTSVSYMAVAGCKNLKAITIPASVEVIEASAFEDCRSIQSITFGGAAGAPGRAAAPAANSQLKKIGNWAFYNAHELQHLDIPEGVEEIGDGAFYGCTYLEDMVLPSSIRAIGDNCFALCSKLTKIVCNATTPPAIQAKTFYDVNRQIPVYVPDEAIASYESDEYWQEFDIQGASDIESAVSNMTNDSATAITKVMRDGQVLIMRDGKMYNLQGVEVK